MTVWTVYLSLCLLVALSVSGAFLEKHMTDVEEGREASEASPNPHSCKDGWSAFGSRCFKFFYNPQTWIDAEKFCLQLDGNLASVHSLEEYMFLQNLIRSATQVSTLTWIGGNDAVQVRDWLWSDGSKMDFQIWAPDKPDDLEHCLEMNYDTDGNWNNDRCSRNLPFVCVKRTCM